MSSQVNQTMDAAQGQSVCGGGVPAAPVFEAERRVQLTMSHRSWAMMAAAILFCVSACLGFGSLFAMIPSIVLAALAFAGWAAISQYSRVITVVILCLGSFVLGAGGSALILLPLIPLAIVGLYSGGRLATINVIKRVMIAICAVTLVIGVVLMTSLSYHYASFVLTPLAYGVMCFGLTIEDAPMQRLPLAATPTMPGDARDGLLATVCFLIPLVGLIIFLTGKDKTPLRARSAAKGALIAVATYFIVVAIALIAFFLWFRSYTW